MRTVGEPVATLGSVAIAKRPTGPNATIRSVRTAPSCVMLATSLLGAEIPLGAVQRHGTASTVIPNCGVQDADRKGTGRIDGGGVGASGRKKKSKIKEPAGNHTWKIIIFRPDFLHFPIA